MPELDDQVLFAKVIASLEQQFGVAGIHKIGSGNEFYISHAEVPVE